MNPDAQITLGYASHLRTDESGAVMVEFAIVFPLIVAGLLAGSSLVATINLAQHVAIHAGSASRYLASAATDAGVSDESLRVARCIVVTGGPGTTTVDCDPGRDCAIVNWCGERAALGVMVSTLGESSARVTLRVEAQRTGSLTGADTAILPNLGLVVIRQDRFRAGQ